MNRLALLVLLLCLPSAAAAQESVRKATGLNQRDLWTTSNLTTSPDPPDRYTLERAFRGITFHEPLAVDPLHGTNRLMVATRPGKVFTFENRVDAAQADLLVDVGHITYGLAVDPNVATSGYVYVAYLFDPANMVDGSRVSRFKLKPGSNPPAADKASEEIILTWPAGGHNGGCLRFGPDGLLYLATGDASPVGDEPFLSGQTISDLTGAILRIDVSREEDGRKYAIPKDNPFVGRQDARGEIWSFGHRQVWRFSFDPPPWYQGADAPRSPRLWAGEVGQDLWEMVWLIQRGGNYGWSIREGSHPFRPERPKGPGEFQKPIVEHPHSDFRSITGGWVYRGKRLPELAGAYLYGDYDMGKIWMLRYDGSRVTEHRQLADTQVRIVDIASDLDGEIYFVDFAGGGLHRLIPAPPSEAPTKPFPQKLSETGLFSSTKDHIPAKGLIPYSVNAPLWSDGAEKERLIAIPGDSQIEFDAVTYPEKPPTAPPGWRFPDGTCLVKTFSLEMEPGNPQSKKRLETRVLQHRRMPGNDDEYGNQVWYGYTYVWNDDQTDAELLAAEGLTRTYEIKDPQADGGIRKQEWRFPSRGECTLCHTMAARYQLGVNTLQMNKDHDYGGVIANQLATLEHIGLFKEKLPKRPEELPRLVDYHDPSADINLRARSYLHANCSHCHRTWGGGNADFHILANLPLKDTKALDARPQQGDLGIKGARIITPGDPARSLLLARMKRLGLGRMPHVASSVVDEVGAKVIEEWIRSLRENDAQRHGIVE